MIDIGRILRRAWQILWRYKVLWIFGLLLVITGGAGGASGSRVTPSNGFPGRNLNNSPFFQNLGQWFQQNLEPVFLHLERYLVTIIAVGLGLLLFGMVVGACFAILRYVSEAAVIRMVTEYEETGRKVGFKQGWRMGWSRAAFRMWLIDLFLSLPALAFALVLLGLGLAVFLSVRGGIGALAVGSLVASLGLVFVYILAFILLMILLVLLSQFFKRIVALENVGVVESIRRGWKMVQRNWKSAALMWLVMVAVGIAWAITGAVVTVLLIPVFVLLALPGLIVAFLPALLAFGIANLFTGSPWTWIIAALAGVPFFLLVVGSPLLLIGGWVQIFSSSVWTLTYREMRALEVPTGSEPGSQLPDVSRAG